MAEGHHGPEIGILPIPGVFAFANIQRTRHASPLPMISPVANQAAPFVLPHSRTFLPQTLNSAHPMALPVHPSTALAGRGAPAVPGSDLENEGGGRCRWTR